MTRGFVSRLASDFLTLTLVSSRGLVLAFQFFDSGLRHEVCYIFLQVIYATAHVIKFTGVKEYDHNVAVLSGCWFWLCPCSNSYDHFKRILQIPLEIYIKIILQRMYSSYRTCKKDISSNYLVRHGLKFVLHLLKQRLHLIKRKKKKITSKKPVFFLLKGLSQCLPLYY